MPVNAILVDVNGVPLHTALQGGEIHLVTEDHSRVDTQFKAATFTDASTVTIVTAPSGGALVLTDLIMSAEKLNGGSVTVQFDDGTNTVIVAKAIVTDAPVMLAIAFAGRWRGWQDADLQVVAVGSNIDGDVSVGYYKVKGEGVLPFNEWDGLR